jgi:hypothetical protein
MAVKASNLAVPVKDDNSTIPEYFGSLLSASNTMKSHDLSAKNTNKVTATNMTLESDTHQNTTTFADFCLKNLLGEFVGGADNDFPGGETKKDNPMQSRQHEDLWHQFDAIPLWKTCKVRAAMLCLLIHATYQFVQEDYNHMEEYLTSKRGIHVSDMLNHFYFNREYWQKQVRTPMYEADAQNNIKTEKHYTCDSATSTM